MVDTQNTLAVLVGGRSQRMGQDKGLLHVNGRSLIQHLLDPISSLFQEILVVCSNQEQREKFLEIIPSCVRNPQVIYRVIVDQSRNDRAAFFGLKHALEESTYRHVVVCAVDQLGLDRSLLKKLLQSKNFPAAFMDENADPIPFPSVWDKGQERYFLENKSVREILKSFKSLYLINSSDEELKRVAINLNTLEEAGEYFGDELKDAFGRRLNYLRMSLTEACNMACIYCLPKGFPGWKDAKNFLSEKHAITILKAFRKLGFSKVRFTGGEPTLHPKVLEIISSARALGYKTISLTTNGSMIRDLSTYVESGLTHLNISLDAMESSLFNRITQSRLAEKVLSLTDAALNQDLSVKLNTVVLREENLDHIPKLIHWAKDRPLTLRFIELMPTDVNKVFFEKNFVSNHVVEDMIQSLGYGHSMNINEHEPAGPAVLYDHPEYPARIGFISPLSCNFCSRCNRLRVTARGKLRLCLFSNDDIELPLEEGVDRLVEFIKQSTEMKPQEHDLINGHWGNLVHFRKVGG